MLKKTKRELAATSRRFRRAQMLIGILCQCSSRFGALSSEVRTAAEYDAILRLVERQSYQAMNWAMN